MELTIGDLNHKLARQHRSRERGGGYALALSASASQVRVRVRVRMRVRVRVLEVVREQRRVDLVDSPLLERRVVVLLARVQVLRVSE